MKRLLACLRLVLALTTLMFAVWALSRALLPPAVLRPFFANRFASVVGEFTFWRVFLANFAIGFLGVQFMNLFRAGRYPGGLFVLPVFWTIYGLLLGTNSFVLADQPVPLSLSVLWTRTGFSELLAYTLGYEASRGWAVWEQRGLWEVRPLGRPWQPQAQDWLYWVAGLALLLLAVAREVA